MRCGGGSLTSGHSSHIAQVLTTYVHVYTPFPGARNVPTYMYTMVYEMLAYTESIAHI